jgi:DNA-binding XRE family transcriptional regulator
VTASQGEPEDPLRSLGSFIRAQRKLANLSLRQVAALADVSNPYLSQIERGLHEPSVRVLRSIARALNVSAETLLESAGLLAGEEPARGATGGTAGTGGTGASPRPGASQGPGGPSDTEAAIRADPGLTDEQKEALLTVYRSYLHANESAPAGSGRPRRAGRAQPRT